MRYSYCQAYTCMWHTCMNPRQVSNSSSSSVRRGDVSGRSSSSTVVTATLSREWTSGWVNKWVSEWVSESACVCVCVCVRDTLGARLHVLRRTVCLVRTRLFLCWGRYRECGGRVTPTSCMWSVTACLVELFTTLEDATRLWALRAYNSGPLRLLSSLTSTYGVRLLWIKWSKSDFKNRTCELSSTKLFSYISVETNAGTLLTSTASGLHRHPQRVVRSPNEHSAGMWSRLCQ